MQGLWLASGIAALFLALAWTPKEKKRERERKGCVEEFWEVGGCLGTCLLGTLGMILGPACQRNSWSGVGDGGICLQSTYRFKVWGKLLAGVT